MATVQPPIQPVERPILCNPYEVPDAHWEYNRDTGIATKMPGRRPAEYWYKTKTAIRGQSQFEFAEGREALVVVENLRTDVAHWRSLNYEGVTPITRELLQHWSRPDRGRRLFFCQLEAVETVIYLAEILRSNRKPRFKPRFQPTDNSLLYDAPADERLEPLIRMCCKMATGSGKTVVMAMLIGWAFCNRGRNPSDERFPSAALICCPNLTVKERLQVLRPDVKDNYFEQFDIIPHRLRPLIQGGKVLVTNWHAFAPKSEHSEGDKSYAVINKGDETSEAFARDRLDELFERLPIMVLNDEAHHCYRPKLGDEISREAKEENDEAKIWIQGLDKINNCIAGKRGISMCVDLSATPFFISGSGHATNSPFPWLVSDFGLVDAIESGITKIPRMPVQDTTGRPDPKYFRLWEAIDAEIEPGQRLPGRARKPKPEVIYEKAQGALIQLSRQWKERWDQIQQASPGQERVPPVLIIVCDNVDIAEVFFRKISGESVQEVTTLEEVEKVLGADDDDDDVEDLKPAKRGAKKPKPLTTFVASEVLPEFGNTVERKHTIRIDSKLLAEAETDEQNKTRPEAAEALRRVVSTVGRRGEPGEHIRCVVSVAMLTEGWDANNVTHILGLRAFTSQLLCEQVVGRGLRRMDYTPTLDPETGKLLLTEEYVDVYGIPFSVVPFKGRAIDKAAPEDRPKNHVFAMSERLARNPKFEIRFPVVDGYAFALKRNLLMCDVPAMEKLVLEPNREPVATFLAPTVGYQEGFPSQNATFGFAPQDRDSYYRDTHIQTIKFQVAKLIASEFSGQGDATDAATRRVRGLQSRHQLFPQIFRFVDEYIQTRVDFHGCNPCELGLERYVRLLIERLRDAIRPDASQGEPPLMPLLNRYKPIGTSSEIDFKTTRPCWATEHSHVNQVVLDTDTWEASTAFFLEQAAQRSQIIAYVRNDHLGLTIPYEFQGVDHSYEPDFIVRVAEGQTAILETKGYVDNQTRAKHDAANRWITAANNWGELGKWQFAVIRDPHEMSGVFGQLFSKDLLTIPV